MNEIDLDKVLPPRMIDRRSPFQKGKDGDGPPVPPRYVYVASSWRNLYQVSVVVALRSLGQASGMQVYDYRAPAPGRTGFGWSEVDPAWKDWQPEDWRAGLAHPIAQAGVAADRQALDRADCGVLVLPCGRSAHLEAGYLAGKGTPVFTLALESVEAELMVLLLGGPECLCCSLNDLFDALCLPKGS